MSLIPAVFQAKKIALAGQQFARNQLMGDSIFCYYYKLFQVTFLQLQSYINVLKVLQKVISTAI